MVRPSGQSFVTFQANLRIAKGIIKLQYYLEDFLKTGGSKSIGVLRKMTNQLGTAIGLGPGGFEGFVESVVTRELESRFRKLDKSEVRHRVDDWIRTNQLRLRGIAEAVPEVGIALERGLLLQAIVVAVSAFEAYVHDVTVEVVSKNRGFWPRFKPELTSRDRGFGYEHIEAAGHEVDLAVGEFVANAFSDAKGERVAEQLHRLAGSAILRSDRAEVEAYERWRAYRNVAVHSAGIVDRRFKQRTKSRTPVGAPVHVTVKTAQECVAFFENLGGKLNQSLRESPRRRLAASL